MSSGLCLRRKTAMLLLENFLRPLAYGLAFSPVDIPVDILVGGVIYGHV